MNCFTQVCRGRWQLGAVELIEGLEPHRPGNGDETCVGMLGRGHLSQWDRLGRRAYRDA